MYTVGLQIAKEDKYAGRATPTGSITIGSTGQPSDKLSVTAKRGNDGDFTIPFGTVPGTNPIARPLDLTLNPVIVSYILTPNDKSTVTAALRNSEWNYCVDGVEAGRASGTAEGKIDVSFDIVRK
jgi:hypothetical protein